MWVLAEVTNSVRTESMGFLHIPAERAIPSLYARSDVQMEMVLD